MAGHEVADLSLRSSGEGAVRQVSDGLLDVLADQVGVDGDGGQRTRRQLR